MKRRLQALALLVVLGLLKLPLEESVTQSLRSHRLLSRPVDLSLREGLGQMGFAASLGGLRSLVASITYLQAYTAFENVNWAKVDSLFQITTRLQPGYSKYWEEASWHMAYNAATSYLFDKRIRPAIRIQLARDHVQRGINILEEGLRFTPEAPKLWTELGNIYARRGLDIINGQWGTLDASKAAECYLRGFKSGALPVYERFAAYEMLKTDDPEAARTAYDILLRNYKHSTRTPSLIHYLKLAEQRLGIPAGQRIQDQEPGPAVPGK